jgi:hypothetical protein
MFVVGIWVARYYESKKWGYWLLSKRGSFAYWALVFASSEALLASR